MSADKESKEDIQHLQKELEAATKEAKANAEKLLRVMAEFENYKKRAAREFRENVKYSHERLVREILPVLDDFERVLSHLPDPPPDALSQFVEGVRLTHRHLWKALSHFETKEVETENKKFDPLVHEAIAQVESDAQEPGTVLECHRKGYLLHDRLLRPASVTVAKPPVSRLPRSKEKQ